MRDPISGFHDMSGGTGLIMRSEDGGQFIMRKPTTRYIMAIDPEGGEVKLCI